MTTALATAPPAPPGAETSVVTAPITWKPPARSGGAPRIEGHAAVFNRWSDDLGFREQITPGAFAPILRSLARPVPLVLNHDQSLVLASTRNGSLTLSEDSSGLRIKATLSGTTLGRDVAVMLEEGLLDRMSFAFRVKRDRWSSDGEERTILEVSDLIDVSVVTTPAYPDAEVGLRRLAAARAARPRVVREPGPYRPDQPHSFFRDLVIDAEALAREELAIQSPRLQGADPGDPKLWPQSAGDVSPAAARRRLALAEGRDISQTAGAGAFASAGAGVPGHLEAEFAAAVRARAVVASAVRQENLPAGLVLSAPRFTTGASVAVQASQNAAVSETDPATGATVFPIATLAGHVDVSMQLLEQSRPGFDQALAVELGAALGARLEAQVIAGSGASGEMRGLLSVAGASASTYTDATPTPAEAVAAIGQAWSDQAAALGYGVGMMIGHPRRLAWIAAKLGYALPVPFLVDRAVASVGVPTNLGAGTNEDAALFIDAESVALYAKPPRFRVLTDIAESSTLTVRVQVYRLASLVVPQPLVVGKLTGTGLVTPTW